MQRESLLTFPCRFPIKVMGANTDAFADSIHALVAQLDSAFDASATEMRPSKAGNYLGLTIYVQATSQDHLDEIYRTLSTHPMVKMAL